MIDPDTWCSCWAQFRGEYGYKGGFQILVYFGPSECFLTDNGKEFSNEQFSNMFQSMNIIV